MLNKISTKSKNANQRLNQSAGTVAAFSNRRTIRRGIQMSDKPISRFPVPQLNELPEDIRDRILAVQEKSGFVPNVFLVLAHRPDEFRAFFAYHDALM
jgi:hypothetical protein